MPGRLGGTSRICRKAVNNGEDPVRATSKRPHGISRLNPRLSGGMLRGGVSAADAELQAEAGQQAGDGVEKTHEISPCVRGGRSSAETTLRNSWIVLCSELRALWPNLILVRHRWKSFRDHSVTARLIEAVSERLWVLEQLLPGIKWVKWDKQA